MDETQCLNSTKKMNDNTQTRLTSSKYPLYRYEELPDYMKDNEYILNYYRADWPLKHALFSLFFCHNETLNIWTHLLGFIGFLVLTVANLIPLPQLADFFRISDWAFPSSNALDVSHNSMLLDTNTPPPPHLAAAKWPLFVFLAGAMFCLMSSSLCHLFACHSRHLNLLLNQLDYTGITVMIIASFFPPIYYIFQCIPVWLYIYLGGITIMGIFAVVTLLSPTRVTGKFRSVRTLVFVAMGLFGIVPAIHATIVNWNVAQRNMALGFESGMAFSYLMGAIFYVSRVPERWRPGWFDLVGHSHQIFHVFVIMGALLHYGVGIGLYEYRLRVGCD